MVNTEIGHTAEPWQVMETLFDFMDAAIAKVEGGK